MGNQLRTGFLLILMTGLMLVIGRLIGGSQGMVLAFILALGMNFFSYWYSDKIVLRMYRAREVTPQQAPELHQIVATLAQRAGLPKPKVFVIPQQAPNAFATGRNPEHAVVAVTQGLLDTMNHEEIMGVLAHEMGHVNNRDILIGTIAATMAGAVMLISQFARFAAFFGGGRSDNQQGGLGIFGLIAMSIVAPLAAMIIQMAVSRSREYQADATGARLAGGGTGLASALEKLGTFSRRRPMAASPSTAHMFIVNPLSGGSLSSLFSTHPPIEDRIARLRGTRPPQPQTDTNVSGQEEQNPGLARGKAFWDNLQ